MPGIGTDPNQNPFNITSQAYKDNLTDKGAKDYSKATKSIEKASKSGGLNTLVDLFTSIIDISGNPLLQVFLKFFEVLSAFFNAGAAEAAEKLADELFSEENIEKMEDMSEAVKTFFGYVFIAADAMKAAKKATDEWGVSIDNWGEDMLGLNGTFNGFMETVNKLNPAVFSFNLIMEATRLKFGDTMNKINQFTGAIDRLGRHIKDAIDDIEELVDALP